MICWGSKPWSVSCNQRRFSHYELQPEPHGKQRNGIQLESGFGRYLAMFRLDHKASDKLTVGLNVRYLNQTIRGAGTTTTGTKSTNRLRHSIQYRPLLVGTNPPVDDFDENLCISSGNLVNPILMTQAEYSRNYTRVLNLSSELHHYQRPDVPLDGGNRQQRQPGRPVLVEDNGHGPQLCLAAGGVHLSAERRHVTINNSNILQYNKRLAGKHDLTVLVGQEIYDYSAKNNTIETRYFPTDISPDQAIANIGLGFAPVGCHPAPRHLERTATQPPVSLAYEKLKMNQRLAHIALVVDDYDEAIAFYSQKLGFTLVEDTVLSPTKRWVLVRPAGSGSCGLLLAKAATPEQHSRVGNQTGGRVFLFLHTDDFWRDYQNLLANNIPIVRPPAEEAYGTVAVFSDIYGNLWDLIGPGKDGD